VWQPVAELSSAISDFSELLKKLRNKILPDGSLDDKASPELARLRREIEKQKRAIQESLRSYLHNLAEGGAVQEELVTIRGERFVIPVKVEQKRRVHGVVHGASSSGQTVFIEPMETIEQNNELVRLLEEEQAEIHRVLLEMTRAIGGRSREISAAAGALAELELQFAKARFAQELNCVAPRLAPGELVLRRARHPLLERNLRAKGGEVVPLDLEVGAGIKQVIISGPNTGGKTVALKTIGLLALMAQAGIPVPAERADLPAFDAVLADIGDYQSIEQNLSTFSAHVTNIDFISQSATPHSLVLLDELGSATDPEEGAALAVAIAEFFRRAQCISVISTHHTSLKVYAANSEGVLNAAVGFDEQTLRPTYELKLGVPGASAGINIAQRLGLNSEIIREARGRLNSQTQDVSRFLDRLHHELRELERERAELRSREQQVAREKNRLEAQGIKEQRAKVAEMEKKLEAVLRDFEYRAREAINAVQDRAAAQKLTKDAERRIAKLRREFKEQFNSAVVAHQTGADAGDPHARPGMVQHVGEGDTVRLKSLGRPAVIKRRIDDHTFEAEVGAMKMKIPREDVAELILRSGENPVQAARARGVNVQIAESESASEINVIGENVDEATRRVERFVDRAFLAGLPRVRIVHGSGMGILRKALRQYLQQHPHVASVSEPPQNEGGAGATVVELRQ
jgi:DNA mismatch repair protein MutS2